MLAGFIRKAKEAKEEKCAEDHRPSAEFQGDGKCRIRPPKDRWECVDGEPIKMDIGPTFPWVDRPAGDVEIETIRIEGEIDDKFEGRKGH